MSPHELYEQVVRLRYDVWSPTVALVRERFPTGRFAEPDDRNATHIVIVEGGRVVAASRVGWWQRFGDLPDNFVEYMREAWDVPGPVGFLARGAVAPDARGRGLSGRMDRAHLVVAQARGVRWLGCVTAGKGVAVMQMQG